MKHGLLIKIIIVLMILCAVAAFLTGCGKTEADRNLDLAQKALAAHDKPGAAKYITRAVLSDPHSINVRLNIVALYTRPGYHNEQVQAVKELYRVLDAGALKQDIDIRKRASIYTTVALLMDKGSEQFLAQHGYEKAVETDPGDPMLSNNLAYFYAEHQIYLPFAEKLARYAITTKAGEPNIEDTMGWVLYRLAKYPEAEEHLLKAVEGISDNPDLRYHLGAVYAAQGKNKQAEIELRKALLLAPKHSDSQLLLNKLLFGHT